MKQYQIAIIVGSLRKDSYNKKLANAVVKLLPEHFKAVFVAIDQLPLYNQDLDGHQPQSVTLFKQQIQESDAVIFVTPEYNRSIPGVLKNVLDHGSRPYGQNSWDKKVAGIMGTSQGSLGTALAQQHLRSILSFLNMTVLNQPEAFIKWSDDMIDEQYIFTEKTRAFIQNWVDAYIKLVEQNSSLLA